MTNAAAIGYMVLAAKEAVLDVDTIYHLETTMYRVMDRRTEEEAEEAYHNS